MKRPPDGKVVLVSGASSGIGRDTALGLAQLGASVAITSRRGALLQEVADQIQQVGSEALVHPADLTDPQQAADFVQAALQRWGRIDVLVSNAGQYIRSQILDLELKDIERSMSINFYSHLYLVQSVLPSMIQQGSGHILFVSTLDAKKGLPLDAPYVSAKFALSGFSEVMRQELRPHGIAVTTIFPGRVDTPMIEDLRVPQVSAKISSKSVSKAILRAIDQRPAEVILPFNGKLLQLLNVVSPRLADWCVGKFHLQGWKMGNQD